MKRRDFLKVSAGCSAWSLLSTALPVSTLFASEAKKPAVPKLKPDHFFVLIRVDGGMDVTLGLDPRIHQDGTDQKDVFIEYRPDEILAAGHLKLGPAAASLRPYFKDVLIINGVNMRRDGGHDANRNYMAAGRGDGTTANVAAELTALRGKAPLGLIRSRDSVILGSRRIMLTQISQLTNDNPDLSADVEFLVQQELKFNQTYSEAVRSLLRAQKIWGQFQERFDQAKLKIDETQTENLAVALSFATGLSDAATLEVDNDDINLDTHTNHVGLHLRGQKAVWDSVARMFKTFKSVPFGGSSVFDHTTFMVVTEFSRTPYLNLGGGKDHNPFTNSVLLAGRGIQGNKVIGGSHVIRRDQSPTGDALHFSTPFDFSTGQLVRELAQDQRASESLNLIYPENVIRTVAGIFGNPSGFNSVSLEKTAVIPGVIKPVSGT